MYIINKTFAETKTTDRVIRLPWAAQRYPVAQNLDSLGSNLARHLILACDRQSFVVCQKISVQDALGKRLGYEIVTDNAEEGYSQRTTSRGRRDSVYAPERFWVKACRVLDVPRKLALKEL